MKQRLGSIVIPAHDEAMVLGRTLAALDLARDACRLEVVVVCNGCHDATSEVARTFPGIEVLELDSASKPAAVRAGERQLSCFPRLYLDADVVLSGTAARRLLRRLNEGPALAARPPIAYDTRASSPLVRAYYRARVRTPAVMTSLWGAGVYGLSERGRSRFGELPDVVADDLFVARHFEVDEIELVDCDPAVVTAPRGARELVRILTRAQRGRREQTSHPGRSARDTTRAAIRDLTRGARTAPATFDATAYAALAVLARLRARGSEARGWERDDSSRSVA